MNELSNTAMNVRTRGVAEGFSLAVVGPQCGFARGYVRGRVWRSFCGGYEVATGFPWKSPQSQATLSWEAEERKKAPRSRLRNAP